MNRPNQEMNQAEAPPVPEVRVFISSTFEDMQPEREYLIKQVFPDLRRFCRQRGVEFTEVDLRWGVTEEEARQGKTIRICLQEIDRCRPHFLGILGDRYGWTPSLADYRKDGELARLYPWIGPEIEQGRSVTDLEVQYGVLRAPPEQGGAFFYTRGSTVPHPRPGVRKTDITARRRLADLKKAARATGVPVRRFSTPQELGQQVDDDLRALIDRRFPLHEVPSPLEQERGTHAAFAASRCRSFIESPADLQSLDSHVSQSGPPLVLWGESGIGKSALLAYWERQYRSRNPDVCLVTHFIGASSSDPDPAGLLYRLMTELAAHYSIKDPLPGTPEALEREFPAWLARCKDKPLVLVLDGLNQLAGSGSNLGWLPEGFPPNVRVIVSTVPGPLLERLRPRGWAEREVRGLDEADRQRLVEGYLKEYGKTLTDSQRQRIAGHPSCRNPLFLRTLLEEMRVFGRFEGLEQRIDHYLAAADLGVLFQRVLQRLEEDYGTAFVREFMSLIGAARYGLSETEILELTKQKRLDLSHLLSALDYHLAHRGGLLSFFHDYLRQAIKQRYFAHEVRQEAAPGNLRASVENWFQGEEVRTHLRLADYFQGQPLSSRQVDELPWQLMRGGAWSRLVGRLTDVPTFRLLATEGKKYELLGYWGAVADRHDLADAYTSAVDRYEAEEPDVHKRMELIRQVADFLVLGGRYDRAEALYSRGLELASRSGDQGETHEFKWQMHLLMKQTGNYAEAHRLQNEAYSPQGPDAGPTATPPSDYEKDVGYRLIIGQTQNESELKSAIGMYRLLLDQFDPVRGPLVVLAMATHGADQMEQEGITLDGLVETQQYFQRQGLDSFLANRFRYNLAMLLAKKGDSAEAEQLFRGVLAYQEKTKGDDHPDTAQVLNALAGVCTDKKDFRAAERYYRRALAIREEKLGPNHPDTAQTLNDLAVSLAVAGNAAEAEQLYRRALTIVEKGYGKEHRKTAQVRENLEAVQGRTGGGLYRPFDEIAEAPDLGAILGPSATRGERGQPGNDLLRPLLDTRGRPPVRDSSAQRSTDGGQRQLIWTIIILGIVLLSLSIVIVVMLGLR
jgi:nephrocystin-3